MGKSTIQYNLTQEEALIIETIRGIESQNTVVKTDVQMRDELLQKYMDMDDYDFIHKYAVTVGDDVILAVLQDTLRPCVKWDFIWSATDEDVINDLFESYVSFEDRRQIFFDLQGREELAAQLVDLTMDEN